MILCAETSHFARPHQRGAAGLAGCAACCPRLSAPRARAWPRAATGRQLDVFEREGKMHVHADLPGMRKEDIRLSIESDQLVISGERRSSHEEGDRQKGGLWHSERSYGSFYRTVPLAEGVDPSTAQASFKDGVLEVRFDAPRRAQQQARTIQIRNSA
jgi:HSP20 family protein